MRLTKVTITGADDSVTPKDLFRLSKRYPFVEWGILLSRNSCGSYRFPSKRWMDELARQYKFEIEEFNFSGHLCGGYVREALKGNTSFTYEIGNIWRLLQRVQINTHGVKHEWTQEGVEKLLDGYVSKEFIFQYDNANLDLIEYVKSFIDMGALFDLSHGGGELPKEWPEPIEGLLCGYAGGLSPENVEENILKIDKVVNGNEYWIDMETKVRSVGDSMFDLEKVESVLKICKKYVV